MRSLSRSRRSVRNIFSALNLEEAIPPIDPGIDVQDVFLRRLSVEPDAIAPFGAAVLTWEVEAPPTVRVKINTEYVDQSGSRVVQPATSSTYRVLAVSSSRSRELGRVDLGVDMSACATFDLLNPQSLLEGALTAGINAMDGVYTRGKQVVEFRPNRINFRLKLGKDINYFPDPTIYINGSFGLGVSDGRLVSWGEQVSAKVTVPKHAWLIPGAVPGLIIALSMAQGTATESGFSAIMQMVRLLEFWWTVANGMRRHSMSIGRNQDGTGSITVTECPQTLLDRFAALDENRAVVSD